MNNVPENYDNIQAVLHDIGWDIVSQIRNIESKKQTKLKNHIEKALGVLVNDGVYAYYVYTISQDNPGKKNNDNKELFTQIFVADPFKKLKGYFGIDASKPDKDFLKELAKDLYKLLFFKELLERSLIYARYHAKAELEAVNG